MNSDLAPRERMKMMVTVEKERKRSGKSTKSNLSTFSNGNVALKTIRHVIMNSSSTWVALEQKPDIYNQFYCTFGIICALIFLLLPKVIHLYLLPWLLTPALYNALFRLN